VKPPDFGRFETPMGLHPVGVQETRADDASILRTYRPPEWGAVADPVFHAGLSSCGPSGRGTVLLTTWELVSHNSCLCSGV
jgi:hypothetical protein